MERREGQEETKMERDGESSSFIVPRKMFCNSLLTKHKTADDRIKLVFQQEISGAK